MARDWLLQRFPKFSTGAELGVWSGNFSTKILKICEPRHLYLIDPWKLYPSVKSPLYGSTSKRTQHDMDVLFHTVKNRFALSQNVSIHRTPTTDFLPDNHLDWVYIDANHNYSPTLGSLIRSLRYVKSGGIIAGDDFQTDGWWGLDVIRAVMHFIDTYPVEVEIIKSNQFMLRKI